MSWLCGSLKKSGKEEPWDDTPVFDLSTSGTYRRSNSTRHRAPIPNFGSVSVRSDLHTKPPLRPRTVKRRSTLSQGNRKSTPQECDSGAGYSSAGSFGDLQEQYEERAIDVPPSLEKSWSGLLKNKQKLDRKSGSHSLPSRNFGNTFRNLYANWNSREILPSKRQSGTITISSYSEEYLALQQGGGGIEMTESDRSREKTEELIFGKRPMGEERRSISTNIEGPINYETQSDSEAVYSGSSVYVDPSRTMGDQGLTVYPASYSTRQNKGLEERYGSSQAVTVQVHDPPPPVHDSGYSDQSSSSTSGTTNSARSRQTQVSGCSDGNRGTLISSIIINSHYFEQEKPLKNPPAQQTVERTKYSEKSKDLKSPLPCHVLEHQDIVIFPYCAAPQTETEAHKTLAIESGYSDPLKTEEVSSRFRRQDSFNRKPHRSRVQSGDFKAPKPRVPIVRRDENFVMSDVEGSAGPFPVVHSPKMVLKAKNYAVVVAIDFGTAYSGYAYAFTGPRRPQISIMRRSHGGDPGVNNFKCPTCLLLTPDKQFQSFGFSARDFYHDLDAKQAKQYLFFDKFKMKLYTTAKLSMETQIPAANGQMASALEIFAHCLRYFKHLALTELADQSDVTVHSYDVQWVVTVPAIWRQGAKQLMREAAFQAGLANQSNPEQLLIALEPEAAALYCRLLDSNLTAVLPTDEGIADVSSDYGESSPAYSSGRSRGSEVPPHAEATDSPKSNLRIVHLDPGDGYLVVDCGAGTVDITAHEIAPNGLNLKEIYQASGITRHTIRRRKYNDGPGPGGAYGSSSVDQAFELLLMDIFSAEFVSHFRSKYPAAYADLMVSFESRKRNVHPYKLNPVNVALPFAFVEFHKKFRGCKVETAVKHYGHKHVTWTSQGEFNSN